MKVHEYQAKELLAAAGANVPEGYVVSSVAEAVEAFDRLGKESAVLKAQIHAGGRGKGHFRGAQEPIGGVTLVHSRDQCRAVASIMLRYPLVTRQTGPEGQVVRRILVQEAADIAREIYVGMVVDRSKHTPVLMACGEGGVEIEEVAATRPEAILKVAVDPDHGLYPFQARRLAYELALTEEQARQAEKNIMALATVFLQKDCSLAEINPLAVTRDGRVIALDAFLQQSDCEVVGVCDIYSPYVRFAASKVAQKQPAPEAYKDYRQLLDRRDIDAVVICTPDHWHALQTIHACQAGKDVYVEKPLSLCVAEGRKMVEAAQKYRRVVQVGIHRRSSDFCREAAQLIRSGYLGKIHVVRCFHIQNEWPKGIGMPPDSQPPADLDWDAWLGPAPYRP